MRTSARAHVLAAVSLFSLNLWICWRLMTVEYLDHFNSIEGSYIAIARYCSRHWGAVSWWPMWHCGMPYQDTYVPLLHLVAAAAATLAKVSAGRAYHGVTGVAYALGAVTLYLLAVRLGAGRGAAWLSAMFYSLLSPSVFLMPEMVRDIGGLWYGRRLQVLTVYGEGPHIAAMTLAALAIAALEYALVKRTRGPFGLAAVAIALVFLTNVPGTMGLALAVYCWIAAQEWGKWKAAWAIAAGASLLAYAIACFGVPPSSVRTMLVNAGPMHSGFSASLRHAPYLLPLVLGSVAGAGYLLQKTRVPLFVRFGALYFALTAGLAITARHQTFELLPQVGRLHLEMELAACLLLGGAGWARFTGCCRNGSDRCFWHWLSCRWYCKSGTTGRARASISGPRTWRRAPNTLPRAGWTGTCAAGGSTRRDRRRSGSTHSRIPPRWWVAATRANPCPS